MRHIYERIGHDGDQKNAHTQSRTRSLTAARNSYRRTRSFRFVSMSAFTPVSYVATWRRNPCTGVPFPLSWSSTRSASGYRSRTVS